MATELAYAMITPYSLLKSRTGGILGRLLLADLELVAARMVSPSDEFVDGYKELLQRQNIDAPVRDAFLQYCDDYLRPDNRLGISNRLLLLLFRGENAARVLKDDVVGTIERTPRGDTVRGTYGDFVVDADGTVEYFEPACFICPDPARMVERLRFLSEFAERDGGLVPHAVRLPKDVEPETTLVILKPDNFKKASAVPGNIVDMFAKTGLFIVGAKVLHMTVAQAEEFYGPLRRLFVEKLRGGVAQRAGEALRAAFEFDIPPHAIGRIADELKDLNANYEFNRIVEYMTGRNPARMTSPGERHLPGIEKCLALLYLGQSAITKIRSRLGATNPIQAESGSVRAVYGGDLMRNAAHASDSVPNAERERKIVGLWEDSSPSDFKKIVDEHLATL